MLEKRKQKVFDEAKAAGYVDQSESLRTAFICQTWASPVVLTPFVTMFVSEQRLVAATDQGNVYTLAVNKWRTTKPEGVISKHPVGSVRATKTALSLQIGDEEKLYAYLFQFAPMNEIAELLNSSQPAQVETAPEQSPAGSA